MCNGQAVITISSVQSLSCVRLFATPWTAACQASLSTPGAYSNSCPSSWWCHPTISSSVVPFSSCLQSFQASGSLPMSQFFASGGQSIVVSASASVLLMNIQDWFPLGLTGWISLQSKGLSRVFSNTTVQKHQFFSAWLSLWFPTLTSIHDDGKNHTFDYMDFCQYRVYHYRVYRFAKQGLWRCTTLGRTTQIMTGPSPPPAACATKSFAFPCFLSVSPRPFRPVVISARHCTHLSPVELGACDFRSWSFPNQGPTTSPGE